MSSVSSPCAHRGNDVSIALRPEANKTLNKTLTRTQRRSKKKAAKQASKRTQDSTNDKAQDKVMKCTKTKKKNRNHADASKTIKAPPVKCELNVYDQGGRSSALCSAVHVTDSNSESECGGAYHAASSTPTSRSIQRYQRARSVPCALGNAHNTARAQAGSSPAWPPPPPQDRLSHARRMRREASSKLDDVRAKQNALKFEQEQLPQQLAVKRQQMRDRHERGLAKLESDFDHKHHLIDEELQALSKEEDAHTSTIELMYTFLRAESPIVVYDSEENSNSTAASDVERSSTRSETRDDEEVESLLLD